MQYRNKNGETFGVTVTDGEAMAFLNGSFIAKAETEKELEDILDHFSHADMENTKKYLGIN